MTNTIPPLADASVRNPAALVAPVRHLSDGRAIMELDYATACTFSHPATEAAIEASTDAKSKVFNRFRSAVAGATIPDAHRSDAARLASGLVEEITIPRPRWRGGQSIGRVDGRAFPRLVEATRLGRDLDTVRPYRARVNVDRMDPPRVAIVADYCWALRNAADGAYERRVGTLACAVLWACEAASLPCTFAAVRGDYGQSLGPHKKVSSVAVLARPGQPLTAPAYRAVTGGGDGDLFVWAHVYATWLAWQGQPAGGYQSVTGSSSGAGGVRWAREIEGATFVIAVGNFPNGEAGEADAHIAANASPAEAVDQIRQQFRLKRNAA